jgi:hypothetical protein
MLKFNRLRRAFSKDQIPSLKEFMKAQAPEVPLQPEEDDLSLPSYLHVQREQNLGKTYFIETHGCQMNVADSEIVETVLDQAGYTMAEDSE